MVKQNRRGREHSDNSILFPENASRCQSANNPTYCDLRSDKTEVLYSYNSLSLRQSTHISFPRQRLVQYLD